MRFYHHHDLDSDWPKYKTRFAWLPMKIWGSYQRGVGQMGTVWLETYRLKQDKKGGRWWPELK